MTWDKAIEIIGHKGYGYPENEIKEAFGMAVEAMEKQKPIRPLAPPLCTNFYCPTCDRYEEVTPHDRFCHICGQALDWPGKGIYEC